MLYKIIEIKRILFFVMINNHNTKKSLKKVKTDVFSEYWNSIFSVMGNITKIKKTS